MACKDICFQVVHIERFYKNFYVLSTLKIVAKYSRLLLSYSIV